MDKKRIHQLLFCYPLLLFPAPLYPISGTIMGRTLDGSSPVIPLLRPFIYFGKSYNQIYVSKIQIHLFMCKSLTVREVSCKYAKINAYNNLIII